MIENASTEFKREYIDDIKKTIIAFANCGGGTLYIDIEDDGTVCGINDVDDCQLRVTGSIRDSIKPDVSMFTRVSVDVIDSRQVVKVEVQHGTGYPYYLGSKGLRPEGVFVRRGASTVPASEAEILKMIREAAGDNYETERSLDQQLTFEYAEKYFRDRNVAFGEAQKRSLGIISEDGTFSNLGLLLSDQCVHTIKFAAFEGSNRTVFKDRKEFGGSLFKQIEDAYSTIQMFNHVQSEYNGLDRIDHYDYPFEAVREALLNAAVHREYSFSESTLISIYDDRLEIITVGGLVKGITKNDIMLGVSILRNRSLANIFYRLHLIEAYGTGLPKIKECYADSAAEPSIEVSDNAFKIVLPNLNFYGSSKKNAETLSPREKSILKYLDSNDSITRPVVQKLTGCSQTTAISTLNKLVQRGILTKVGSAGKVRYKK